MKLHVSLTAFRLSLFGSLGLAAATTGAACVSESVTFTCTPVASRGVVDGFELCQEGYYHRVEQVTCAVNEISECGGKGAADSTCQTDGDCDGGPSHCVFNQRRPVSADGLPSCFCAKGCLRDEHCGLGGMCDCQQGLGEGTRESSGSCLTPNALKCRVDADCGPGGICASHKDSSCGSPGFSCLRPEDECVADEECKKIGKDYCGHNGSHRTCLNDGCVEGRPFRVESENRVAPLAARADWALVPVAPEMSSLPAALRAELGAHWARLGQMEHASVAAFARFALHLLALGAPPELVAGAQAAMADELVHARLCFGLASALGGQAVGPGPLSLAGAFADTTLTEAVRLAVIEGCVGETLAALEAAEAGERASDPGVLAVLGQVRGDETRHAELAWRFVAWAIELGGGAVREAAREAFALACSEVEAPGGEAKAPDGDALFSGAEAQALAFGLLPERVRGELRRRALREVVRPCAERLLATTARGASVLAQGGAKSAEASQRAERSPCDLQALPGPSKNLPTYRRGRYLRPVDP